MRQNSGKFFVHSRIYVAGIRTYLRFAVEQRKKGVVEHTSRNILIRMEQFPASKFCTRDDVYVAFSFFSSVLSENFVAKLDKLRNVESHCYKGKNLYSVCIYFSARARKKGGKKKGKREMLIMPCFYGE